MKLTHLDKSGKARMVDVTSKRPTQRMAHARGAVRMKRATLELIMKGGVPKGDALGVAKIAAIQAAKLTPTLIPLCHPLNLTSVEVNFTPDEKNPGIIIDAVVKLVGVTGAEMEALTAAAVAGLTIYDMCKAADKEMTIGEICLVEKTGGKSGAYRKTALGPRH